MATVNNLDPQKKKSAVSPTSPPAANKPKARAAARGRIVRDEDLEDGDEELVREDNSSLGSDESGSEEGSEDEQQAEGTGGQTMKTSGSTAGTSSKPTVRKPAGNASRKDQAVGGGQDGEKPTKKPRKKKKRPVKKAEENPTSPTAAGQDQESSKTTEQTPGATTENAEARPRRPSQDATKARSGYVNPDRVNTGGMKTEKLSAEELAKVMERMRLNNEQLKARRELVEADEASFKSNVQAESERQKAERLARNARAKVEREARSARSESDRKIQEQVDAQRAEAAKRKLAKQDNREWDADKDASKWAKRGGPPGGGRGGRGRGAPRGDGGPPRLDNTTVGPSPTLSSLVDAALAKTESPGASADAS